MLPVAPGRGRLLRALGVGFGLAVIIGNTIGAGILRAPGEVAAQLPGAGWFLGVWLIGGLYALLGAISMAELGTMLPRSGGQYVFARRALGPYAGFIVGWSDWLSTCGATAAIAVVIAEYAGVLFPRFAGQTIPLALVVTIAFMLLQWRGIHWGSRAQNLTSLLKAAAFLALVAACFLFGGESAPAENSAPLSMPAGGAFFVALIVALQAVIYTYDGWTGVIYFSEEVREPARDIPRALFGGVLAIIAIYLSVNLALLYVLPLSAIAGQTLAVGAAAEAIFGAYGDTVIRTLTIISMLSAINACQLMASRVLFTMSRDGLFTDRAVRVNRGGTPTVTLFVSALAAALFILYGGAFAQIIAALAFFFVANYAISFLSLFVLRWREPELSRPYRAWGYPWTTGLALLCSLAFLVGAIIADTENNSRIALVLLAASLPLYLALKLWARAARSKPSPDGEDSGR